MATDEAIWVLQDWSWDSFRMTAARSSEKQSQGQGSQVLQGTGQDSAAAQHEHNAAEGPQPLPQHEDAAMRSAGDGGPSTQSTADPNSSASKTPAAAGQDVVGHSSHRPAPETSDANGSQQLGVRRQRLVCQVDGCNADLSALKEYHQRYKICSYHLKVNHIEEDGKQQRFCQQCGRFHDLSEFDGDKRSCRARLQRHNARRRKKGDEDAALGAAFAKKQLLTQFRGHNGAYGAQASDFGLPGFGGAAGGAVNSAGNSAVGGAVGRTQQVPDLSNLHSIAGLRISEWTQQQQQAQAQAVAAATGGGPTDMSLDQAISELLVDGARAAAVAQVLPKGNNLAALLEGRGQTANGNGRAAAGANFPGAGDVAGDVQQQLRLALQGGGNGNDALSALLSAVSGRQQQQQQQQAGGEQQLRDHQSLLATALNLATAGAGGNNSNGAVGNGNDLFRSLSGLQQVPPALSNGLSTEIIQQALALQQAARDQQHRPAPPVLPPPLQYGVEQQLTRISAKLFNCTPADLHADLKANLVDLLACSSSGLDAALRPGCVFLTVDARLDKVRAASIAARGVRSAVEELLAAEGDQGRDLWHKPMLVQMHDEIAWVHGGRVQHVLSLRGSRGVCPVIDYVSPCCVLSSAPDSLTMVGANISEREDVVLVRYRGSYVPVEVVDRFEQWEEDTDDGDDEECSGMIEKDGGGVRGVRGDCSGRWLDGLEVALAPGLALGLPQGTLRVEVQRGGLMSPPRTVLALDDLAAVNQLRQAEAVYGIAELDALLVDIGYVLEAVDTQALRHRLGADTRARNDHPMREYSASDLECVAGTAARLVAFACAWGWDALVGLLLLGVSLSRWTAEHALEAMDEAAAGGAKAAAAAYPRRAPCGTALLRACASSGDNAAATLCVVLAWASAQGLRLRVDALSQGVREGCAATASAPAEAAVAAEAAVSCAPAAGPPLQPMMLSQGCSNAMQASSCCRGKLHQTNGCGSATSAMPGMCAEAAAQQQPQSCANGVRKE